MFVDSDHAEDKVSLRSRSCFLISVNTTLVQWFSKKQSTVETSVFGTEFVTMRQEIYALRGIRFYMNQCHRSNDKSPLWAKEKVLGQ